MSSMEVPGGAERGGGDECPFARGAEGAPAGGPSLRWRRTTCLSGSCRAGAGGGDIASALVYSARRIVTDELFMELGDGASANGVGRYDSS